MGWLSNLLGTTESIFKVGKSTLSATASVDNTVTIPKLTSKLLAFDPSLQRVTLGNDTTDVPGVFMWSRGNGEIQVNNDSGSFFGVATRMTVSCTTPYVSNTPLMHLEGEGYNAFSDNSFATLYVRASNVMVRAMKWTPDNARVQTLSLGAADGSGFAGTLSPSVTASRTYNTPDRNGFVSLDDPQEMKGLTIQTEATGATITVGAGSAYVESAARVIPYAGGTITGAPVTNTTYHIYLLNDGTVEKSTTAPGAPYSGSARSKTADTTRRYLGSIRSISVTAYIPQKTGPGGNECRVAFMHNVGTLSTLVTAGVALVATDVSAVNYAPAGPTSSLNFRVQNGGPAGVAQFYAHNGTAFTIMSNVAPASAYTVDIPCDTTPKVQYAVTSTSTMTMGLLGYTYRR